MDYRFNIALIYDFDGTLAPGNMQEYDFIPAVGKSNKEFWTEANTLAEEQDADMVLTYMARMLQEAKSKGLSLRREAFQESGRRVTLYKGVKEWFARINAYGAAHGIRILHYINSSGMKEIIEGTEIAHEFRKIYAPAGNNYPESFHLPQPCHQLPVPQDLQEPVPSKGSLSFSLPG